MTHYINYMIVQYIFPKMTVMKKWAIKIIKKSRNYELIGNMCSRTEKGDINSVEKYFAFRKHVISDDYKKNKLYDRYSTEHVINNFRISNIIKNINMLPISKKLPHRKMIKTLRNDLELVRYKDNSSNHNCFFSENNSVWSVKYLLKNPNLLSEVSFSMNTSKKAIKYLLNNPKYQDWFGIATTHSS